MKWNGEENFFKQKLWRIYARIDSEFKLKGWNNSYYLIPSIISHIYYKLDYYIQNYPIFNLPHWLTTILKIIKLLQRKKIRSNSMNTQCTATVCRRARRTMKRGSSLVLIPSTTHRGGSQMWDQGWNVSQGSQPSPSRNCIGRFDSPVTRSSGKNTRKRERRLSSWNLLWFNQRDRLVTLFLFFPVTRSLIRAH